MEELKVIPVEIVANEECDLLDEYDLKDYMIDYLAGEDGEELTDEYKALLNLSFPSLDLNRDNYERYTTCYGNFLHFKHLPTGKSY